MGMSRCYSLMKCVLILFNIILMVVGAGACGAACWALWDGRAGETPQGRAALCAAAAWGAALAIGSLASIAGAIRHSASWLAAAFAVLALTAVAEGAAAWWGAAHLPQLRRALTDRLTHTVQQDYGRLPARTNIIDAIQQGLECCGSESTRDWQSSVWGGEQAALLEPALAAGDAGGEGPELAARKHPLDLTVRADTAYYYVPPSCCKPDSESECEVSRRVPAASGSARGLHSSACAPLVLQALERGARAPLLAGAALLGLHALALLLALALCLRAHPHTAYKA